MCFVSGDDSLRKKQKLVFEDGDGNLQVTLNKKKQARKPSTILSDNPNRPFKRNVKIQEQEVENIKIKTLAEIRAERNARLNKIEEEREESEVSSTSKEEGPLREAMDVDEPQQNVISTSSSSNPLVRKIRIRRKLPLSENVMSSSTNTISTNYDPLAGTNHAKDRNTNLKGITESPNEEKILDDVLLLEEDDDDYDITLKAEEDLLNDIDDDD